MGRFGHGEIWTWGDLDMGSFDAGSFDTGSFDTGSFGWGVLNMGSFEHGEIWTWGVLNMSEGLLRGHDRSHVRLVLLLLSERRDGR